MAKTWLAKGKTNCKIVIYECNQQNARISHYDYKIRICNIAVTCLDKVDKKRFNLLIKTVLNNYFIYSLKCKV